MAEFHVPILRWNSHWTPPFQHCNHASDFSVHVQMGLETLKQMHIDACHIQEYLHILPYYTWRGLQQVPDLPVFARWPHLHSLLLWEGLSVPACHNKICWIRHTKHTNSSFKTHHSIMNASVHQLQGRRPTWSSGSGHAWGETMAFSHLQFKRWKRKPLTGS